MEKRDSGNAVQNPRRTYFDQVLVRSKHKEIVQIFYIVMPLCLLIAVFIITQNTTLWTLHEKKQEMKNFLLSTVQ